MPACVGGEYGEQPPSWLQRYSGNATYDCRQLADGSTKHNESPVCPMLIHQWSFLHTLSRLHKTRRHSAGYSFFAGTAERLGVLY